MGVRLARSQRPGLAPAASGEAPGAPAGALGAVRLPGCITVRTIRRRPGAAARGRRTRARGDREQAPRYAISLRRMPGLAQGQDGRLARSQSGAMAIVRARLVAHGILQNGTSRSTRASR